MRRAWKILAPLALLLARPALAAEPTVLITSPPAGESVFGEVRVAADVLAAEDDPVVRVEFFADDAFIGARQEPPWEVYWDAGQENEEHRFEVVATSREGRTGSSLLVSRRIAVNLELDASLQQIYVTVERDGRRVLDLQPEEVRVFDRGELQELVTFERGDVPWTASILIDASRSMSGERLRAALAGADAFLGGMRRLDQAQLLLFSDRVIHETPFTSMADVLRVGLDSARAEGATSMIDHLYLALRRLEPLQGRRVILLLSDGIDVSSFLRMGEVLETVRRSQTQIYWLRLGNGSRRLLSAWKEEEEHREQLEQLEGAVRLSGGRIVQLSSIEQTGEAFDKILRELREQYALGYYPLVDVGDGGWHPLRVETTRGGLEVRAREGYVDR
ncbi:MAG: VWA domain-containing protein [Acidobacteriota bacterium]